MNADDPVIASQQLWLEQRSWLASHRDELVELTAKLYADYRVPETSVIALPEWIPAQPVDLDALKLEFVQQTPAPEVTGQEPETASVRPLRTESERFESYASAMEQLNRPALFESRLSYRLLNFAPADNTLQFGTCCYFDKIDMAGALTHEIAALCMADPALLGAPEQLSGLLPFRELVGNPFNLLRRTIMPGLAVLTIRRSATGGHSFLMHWRDPARVAGSGGIYHVIPAGEFQPTGPALWNLHNDFSLWRNVIREYAEELLGYPEYDSSDQPLDYQNWDFYQRVQSARAAGEFTPSVFGLTMTPLSLNLSILIVVVIDDSAFHRLFGNAIRHNDEGKLVGVDGQPPANGIPFTASAIQQLMGKPLGTDAVALLKLAWKHRRLLLG